MVPSAILLFVKIFFVDKNQQPLRMIELFVLIKIIQLKG